MKYLFAVSLFATLTSCRRTIKLSETDYSWMPYKGNEILIITSNNGKADRITLLKKDTLIAVPEAQALNGRTYEEVRIFCQHSDPTPGPHRYLENEFVSLHKSLDKKARLYIRLLAKDAWFYRLNGISVDSLEQQPQISLKTRHRTYSDVYIIESEDWLNFKQRSNYVTRLYWSKSEGLIRFDKQDSVFWELDKKYSP